MVHSACARAVLDRGQGIGDRQAQIVVAMARQDDFALAQDRQFAQQMGEDFAVAGRGGVADGVGEIDGGCAGFHRGLHDLFQKFQFGPARVLRRKFDVLGVLQRLFDRLDADFNDLFLSLFQLVIAMNLAGGAKDVNAGVLCAADGFTGAVDVLGDAAGQAADDGFGYFGGDGVDGFKIAVGTDGESGFDDVDAHGFQETGDFQLFASGQGRARRLLAVAQSGVEDSYGVVGLVVGRYGVHGVGSCFVYRYRSVMKNKKPCDLDRRASFFGNMNRPTISLCSDTGGKAQGKGLGKVD